MVCKYPMYEDYDGDETSPNNIVIRGNKLDIFSEYMIYGITVISAGIQIDEDGEMELCAFPLNITIADNVVYADSDKGVIGIAGKVYNMTVINNNVTAIGTSAEGVVSYDEIGVGTYALGVVYNGANAEDDPARSGPAASSWQIRSGRSVLPRNFITLKFYSLKFYVLKFYALNRY